jgi:membrane-bound lytic murein transglycosylase B
MLTIWFVLLAAAASGQDQSPAASIASRRDPFVSPRTWKAMTRSADYRRDWLARAFVEKGLARDEAIQLLERREVAVYPRPQRHGGGVNWKKLETEVLSASSVEEGLAYYRLHRPIFDRTERETGVPASTILALIRIESNFDTFAFDPRVEHNLVFNIYYTRVVRGGRNWRSAARTLAGFVAYCKANGIDPLSVRGSYAGAFGIVQFMPFNVVPYGVDGNQDGRVDLFDHCDAIPSAANFLLQHGWRRSRTQALVRYYGARSPYQRIARAYEQKIVPAITNMRNTPAPSAE